jgi:putative ABC transport system ATP-binding protein
MALNNTSHGERARLRRKSMGFIFQSYNLLPVYSVFENVELPLILNKVDPTEREKRVTQALEWVGLSDKTDSRPAMLSGGECQRTAIARAIVHQPALILADEPTANLDAENSHHIMNIMVRLNRELSTSFIFATHDEKIMAYLRRIIHLDDGQITEDEQIDNPKAGK